MYAIHLRKCFIDLVWNDQQSLLHSHYFHTFIFHCACEIESIASLLNYSIYNCIKLITSL